MKDLFLKYWKVAVYSLVGVVAVVLLYKGGSYVYSNTYAQENYQYASKTVQNQVFDQNVSVEKKVKRNGTKGEVNLKFDKKDISEEYSVDINKKIVPSRVKVSVTGQVGNGDISVRLIDDKNAIIFDKTVKGSKIEEVSTPFTSSQKYKLVIAPNGAQNGDVKVSYSFE